MKRTFHALTVIKAYWTVMLLMISFILFVNMYYTIVLRETHVSDVSILDPAVGNDLEVQVLSDVIQRKNEIQLLHYRSRSFHDFELIALVQVHKRIENLKLLIKSMSKVHNVSKVLIIFSHDYFDKDIDEIIAGIKFTKALQIFYPYSNGLYPNMFPGDSPNDCPRDIGIRKARLLKCINAEWPDSFGHYREAKFTQIKHHWWWKINELFDKLQSSCNYNGPLLLLEEDYYVSPDLFNMVKKMYERKESLCNRCGLLTFGSYRLDDISEPENSVHITAWHHSLHNIGIVLDRKIWNDIKSCSSRFCTFDDYNWDVSLHNVIRTCAPHLQWTLSSDRPRIFHLGICGTHKRTTDNCDLSTVVKSIEEKLIYDPVEISDITLSNVFNHSISVEKMNGGWGDHRDHALCELMSSRRI